MSKAERFIGKDSVGRQLVASRLIYGTRSVTLLYCGIKKVNFLKFAATDFAVCAVWVSLLVSIGYFLSSSVNNLVGDIKEIEFGLLILVVCIGGLILLWKFLKREIIQRETRKVNQTPKIKESSGISTYSVTGAAFGLLPLWTALFSAER